MRHFVRFAKMAPSGLVDRAGWRLRIFLTPREAGAFAETLVTKLWRVETGHYEDGEIEPPGSRGRRFHAEALALAERRGRAGSARRSG